MNGEMAIYTKDFSTEDDYQEWLSRAGAKVRVITIKSREAPPTRSGLHGKHQMTVTFQTTDTSLGPQRNVWLLALEFILLIFVLYGVVGYTMHASHPSNPDPVPLRLP
jgi:hypothetical protein